MKLVVQDMDLKNPVLAVVPRDNQKTITRVRVRVRVVRVRVRVWVKVKVIGRQKSYWTARLLSLSLLLSLKHKAKRRGGEHMSIGAFR